ncbi:MAG: UbiA-like polyprenyltransferase [Deltaproteobacteria bacterium]|nr:UbiA-like polyprenyltransferase [Deltaproteobacteria bacterium]
MTTFVSQVQTFGRMIKFSHTIFALPFALAAAAIAARGHGLSTDRLFAIIVAMATARTSAMGWNRIVDRHYDAQNPRTATREIPSGKISVRTATGIVVVSSLLFLAAAAYLGRLCFTLSPIALGLVLGYSYTKRFTWLCHLFLGFAIAAGPAGAWIAVTGSLSPPALWLVLAVTTWIGGFDVLYALSDREFDQHAKLRSIPARFGVVKSLWISGLLHVATAAALLMTGVTARLGLAYFTGVAVIVAILIWEHSIVKPKDLSRLNMAFFGLNGYVSMAFLLATLVDVGLRYWL